MYFLVYVEVLIITGSCSTWVAHFIQILSSRFSVKDMAALHYFLGVEVISTNNGLFLSQQKYIRDILERTKMDGAKINTTPLSTSTTLVFKDNSPPADAIEYCCVIRSLPYLSLTRLDIFYAVNKLSQFMHSPSQTHWAAIKWLLQ